MNATVEVGIKKLSAKDYASDQDVRWCPGCGDYAILKAVQKTLADLAADPAQTVFISGIGCSSRFPYYLSTYGFHTIHGRAPAIATGVKLSNPELDVWVVTGDGDGLSIGGNHLLHVLRRNVNLQILLFNNEVYGLTKGQYSPTSQPGMRSPSTPRGSLDAPANPALFALGAGGHFIARAVDTMAKHLPEVLKRAHAHQGAAFVEILQNCIVYNDGVFKDFTDKSTAADRQLLLEHGQALRFGRDRQFGLRLNPRSLALETAILGENGVTEDDLLIHDETNPTLANLLARLTDPLPLGVLYCNPATSYEQQVQAEHNTSAPISGDSINALLRQGNTWVV